MNAVAEVRWFLVNYALLNAYCFVFAVLDGLALMATYGGSIPGWDGSPVQQLVFSALTFVLFLPLVFGIPVLLVALLAWRLAIRLVGHPRLTAYLVATVLVIAAAIRIERTEPLYLAIVLVAVLGFATIVLLPPRADAAGGPVRNLGLRLALAKLPARLMQPTASLGNTKEWS